MDKGRTDKVGDRHPSTPELVSIIQSWDPFLKRILRGMRIHTLRVFKVVRSWLVFDVSTNLQLFRIVPS